LPHALLALALLIFGLEDQTSKALVVWLRSVCALFEYFAFHFQTLLRLKEGTEFPMAFPNLATRASPPIVPELIKLILFHLLPFLELKHTYGAALPLLFLLRV